MTTPHRSPSYPYLTLQDAIKTVDLIYKNEKRHAVPVSVIAKHAGYKDMKSSSALRTIASLNHYGLVHEEGAGDSRSMRLSDLALDIVLAESSDAPERKKAIREAAKWPIVHQKILQQFAGGLPSDGTLRNYLIRELNFNDTQVDSFISKFRKTVDFADIYSQNELPSDELPPLPQKPVVGSFVQWTNSGVDQLPTPLRVREIDPSGEWALLEGANTGVPMSELTVVDPPPEKPANQPGGKPAVPNPFVSVKTTLKPDGPFISFPLTNDNTVELRLSSRISRKDFDRLKKLIDLSEDSLVFDEGANGE